MLRDRIVIGVNDPNIQRRLLAEPNLTLKKALEIAQALETAERIYSLLQPLSRLVFLSTRCGGKHLATTCKFICFNCGKKGHTYKVCRSKGKPSKSTGDLRSHKRLICIVEHLTRASTIAPFVVSVQVDEKYLKMEVDMDASVLLITKAILGSYSGESIKVLGEMEVTVQYQDQKKKLNLLVKLHLRSAARLKLEDVLKKHADVFKEELGKVIGMEVKLHMDPDAQPQFFRPCPVPLTLRPKVEMELERLVKTSSSTTILTSNSGSIQSLNCRNAEKLPHDTGVNG
eukprot:Em0006g139a